VSRTRNPDLVLRVVVQEESMMHVKI